MALTTGAFAQWTLSWYVDTENGSTGLVTQQDGITPMTAGMPVYLMMDGGDGFIGDGTSALDVNGNVLGDDVVVVLFGGGYAAGSIGQIDFPPFNNQGNGEFFAASSIQDAYQNQDLFAIAFNNFVAYDSMNNRFVGSASFFGSSSMWYGHTTAPNQYWDATGWSANTPMVPEPATMALMGAGLAGILAYRRRRMATR